MDAFLQSVVLAYKKESNNLGFVPIPRLKRDYALGRFFKNENGFILIGSPKSEHTPIHAVYIYPEKRNGSVDKVVELLRMLPKKKYRVSCCFGNTFWKRVGLSEIGVREKKNTRKRKIYVLEGEINPR